MREWQIDRSERSGYLPGLDGWRGVAIVGVMFAHDARHNIHGWYTGFYQGMGGYGVELFFAISGVLISWRIMEDEKRTGSFSLKAFYIRRFFRIQPPQWVYLSVLALWMGLHIILARWKYWWGALLLYENFLWHNLDVVRVVRASYLVGHFWTLAVEEHFYLLISLFFFVVKRRRWQVLGACFVVVLSLQAWGMSHGHFSIDVSDRRTYWAIQYLLFAAWSAIVLREARVLEAARLWFKPWVAFASTAVLLVLHHLYFYGPQTLKLRWLLSWDANILFYCFTGWIIAVMLHPLSWTTRVLELRPIRFLGRISYSIYLWHLVFFGGGAAERCTSRLLTLSNQWELSRFGLSIAVASLSYYFVEKPMIRLGHRLAPPATPGHRDLAGDLPATPLLTPVPASAQGA